MSSRQWKILQAKRFTVLLLKTSEGKWFEQIAGILPLAIELGRFKKLYKQESKKRKNELCVI